MTTDDFDAMEDMQNETRALAEKISSRARRFDLSPDTREVLRAWAVRVNEQANDMAGEISKVYID